MEKQELTTPFQASRKLPLILLTLCLLVAAVLRFTDLDLMEYKSDESETVQNVSMIVDDRVFLTHGERSSKGPHQSPLPLYLLAPAWAMVASPLALVWWIALWNVAAVGVTYWIGHRFLSPRAGLIAAYCYAVSPWAVMFSRKIWRADMEPLFGALLLAATLALVVNGRRRAIFWICLLAGVVVQIHPTGYLAVGAVLLLLILYRPHISRPSLILGLGIMGGILFPYGVFLAGGGWKEFHQLFSGATSTGVTSWFHQVEWLWNLVNLGKFTYLIGKNSFYIDERLGSATFLVYPLAALGRWIFFGSLGWLAWRTLRPRKEPPHLRPVGLLLILWVALPTVACSLAPWRCYPHYYLFSYPAQFLVLGAGVDSGLTRLRSWSGSALRYRAVAGLVGLTLMAMLLSQAYFTITFFSSLRALGGAIGGDYGITYRHKLALADHLAQTFGPGCYRLTYELPPLFKSGIGVEVDDLVHRRAAPTVSCAKHTPTRLYLLESIDWPPPPQIEARFKPYERFGPIILYRSPL